MNEEIRGIEYQWFRYFVDYIITLLMSIGGIVLSYHLLSEYRVLWLLLIPSIYLFFNSIYEILQRISNVPKLIILRTNNLTIVYPFGSEKVFSYSDVCRLVIGKKSQWSSEFTAKLFLLNNTVTVKINPDRAIGFDSLPDTLISKGLGGIIENH